MQNIRGTTDTIEVVTAAAVVAKTDSETGEGYFYRDSVLPEAGSDRGLYLGFLR